MKENSGCAWMALSARMLRMERFMPEVILALSSMWAAHSLLTEPSNFVQFPAAFSFAGALGSEHWWAFLVIVGAMLKIMGLATICFRNVLIEAFSIVMRLMGLAVSGMFWTIMGASSIWGNPDTLFGFLGLLSGFSAWWLLIRFPTVNAHGSN